MEESEGFRRHLQRDVHLYDFCIKFLRITGIRLPVPPRSRNSAGSSSKDNQKYFLKVTLLHGTEQQKIGDFEIVDDECDINHQLTCRILHGRPDVLTKLHVYIDQAWSAGLSGHITVDLKEFFEDTNTEVYLEYPLFASGPSSHASRMAKLEMTVLCTCSEEAVVALTNQPDQDQGFIFFEDHCNMRPTVPRSLCPPVESDSKSIHHEHPMLLSTAIEEIGEPDNMCLAKVDREICLLKEMEGDLIELNAKLNRYVAAYNWKDNASGPYRKDATTRPEVIAAMFFAAGMAFQRQVDRVNQLMMSRDAPDPLLPGEYPDLLLEDISDLLPNKSNSTSQSSEGEQEVVTYCKAREETLPLRGDSVSDSCGPPQPSRSNSDVATSCRSLGDDLDETADDEGCVDSALSMNLNQGSESTSPSTSEISNQAGSPLTERRCSRESKEKQESPHQDSRTHKDRHKLPDVLESVLGAIALVGLSVLRAKDAHCRSKQERPVAAAGSIVARQHVASIQSVLKSNPGLGALMNLVKED